MMLCHNYYLLTYLADMLADCLTKRGADFSKLAKVVEEGFCDAITKC